MLFVPHCGTVTVQVGQEHLSQCGGWLVRARKILALPVTKLARTLHWAAQEQRVVHHHMTVMMTMSYYNPAFFKRFVTHNACHAPMTHSIQFRRMLASFQQYVGLCHIPHRRCGTNTYSWQQARLL
jgi:hypothetical protein